MSADLSPAQVAGSDGQVLTKDSTQPAGYAWVDGAGGGGTSANASSTVKGITKLSVDPVSATAPIAVGDNDTRMTNSRAPSGAAGGDLTGTYPSPTIGAGKVTSSHIADGAIVDADVNASAAIAKSKLAALSIVDADVSAISESKVTNLVSDLALKAPLASPALTGTPTVPTAAPSTNTTQAASTAYADAAVAVEASARSTADALLAPKASPALTGTPTVPTATQGTNTTQAASTAYVQTEVGLLVPKSVVTAKGDLIVATASGTVTNKAVGSDGQVLTADAASTGGIKWATASGGGVTFPFKTGLYYSPYFTSFSAGNPGTGTATYIPLMVATAKTFDRIACFVNASGASSVIRLGIFNDDGTGQPGTLVVDGGTIDASTTGAKEVVVSQSLSSGYYWLGAAVQVASSSPLLANTSVLEGSLLAWTVPVNGGTGGYKQAGVTGAFANASGFTTISGSSPITVWLRAA